MRSRLKGSRLKGSEALRSFASTAKRPKAKPVPVFLVVELRRGYASRVTEARSRQKKRQKRVALLPSALSLWALGL